MLVSKLSMPFLINKKERLKKFNQGKENDLFLVPFALGKVIDIIYSMDQLKGSSLEQQKQEISKRLKWVCLGNKCV
jgi:hypothetical protein